MENRIKIKLGTTDKVILGIGYTLLGLFVLAIAIPLVYVVIASFMDPNVLNNQGISFNFKDWTIDAYRRVLENDMIWRGFANSLFAGGYTPLPCSSELVPAEAIKKSSFRPARCIISFRINSPIGERHIFPKQTNKILNIYFSFSAFTEFKSADQTTDRPPLSL